jgi:uncharacterized protein DUF3857/transglutaminase superfamily protein
MRTTVFLPFLFLAATVAAADKPPSWLSELASRGIPKYASEVSAVELLRERTVTVLADGRVSTVKRGAVKILTPGGREHAVGGVTYRTDSGKVKSLRAWLIYPSGKTKKYGKQEIMDAALVESDVYNESRTRAVIGRDDADPGAVFGYESVQEDRSIFTQFSFAFQNELPVLTSRFTLQLPAGWKAEAVTFNHEEIPAEEHASVYTWQLSQLAPVEEEPARVALSSIAPSVAVSYYPEASDADSMGPTFRNWSEVSGWLATLHDPPVAADDAIRAKAREISGGADTQMDKIRAIGRFAQDVRYISIQTGLDRGGGYRPHAAPEILRKSYGDCKDKVTLMRALLREVGVESFSVSINATDRYAFRKEWPSPHQFDHVIIAVSVAGGVDSPAVGVSPRFGRLLYFDPTDAYTPVGEIPEALQNSYALIVAPGGGELVSTPMAPGSSNRLHRSVEASLDEEGRIDVRLIENCSGSSGTRNRRLYQSLSKPDYRKVIEHWISADAPGANVSEIVVDDAADSEFSLSVAFDADHYGQTMRDRLLIFLPAVVSRRDDTAFCDAERRHPVVLSGHKYTETATFQLPESFEVDESPEPVELSTGFGRYKAAIKIDGHKLIFERQLDLDSALIPPSEYGELRNFFAEIQRYEQTPVVLIRH